MPSFGNVIRWGTESARVGRWRADGSVAFFVPIPDGTPASAEFVRRCLGVLAEQGFQRVITSAVSPPEQAGLLQAGFEVHEHLHLLLLPRRAELPPVPAVPRPHRAGPVRRAGLLKVDGAAFAPFWRLDRAGLREAVKATRQHHLRVALGDRRAVVGYAICGTSGNRGFVQRLAVSPATRGRGIGKALLLDGLHWLRAAGAHEIAVNTQVGNDPALALYRRVGFRDDPDGLAVLSARLNVRDASEVS
ncbi:MAG: GNAT family N-acetyltransferase [Acidimicrobiales bacterium]|jgi:ribosomal-protein-alanine N-acetyltransferase